MFRVEQKINVSRQLHCLIARSIRKVTRQYGVIVDVPTKEEDCDSVFVLGPHQDSVNQACHALMDSVEKIRLARNKRLDRSDLETVD